MCFQPSTASNICARRVDPHRPVFATIITWERNLMFEIMQRKLREHRTYVFLYLYVLRWQRVCKLSKSLNVHGDKVGGKLVLGDVQERAVVRVVDIHLYLIQFIKIHLFNFLTSSFPTSGLVTVNVTTAPSLDIAKRLTFSFYIKVLERVEDHLEQKKTKP